eukprot:TCALIF_11478-PA protein Name:"Similar to STRA13 Centromere protein X (Pongo abelii)" AED:0.56 eAED:0.56 QI:0/-1/0/1/-1/1/1/0/114
MSTEEENGDPSRSPRSASSPEKKLPDFKMKEKMVEEICKLGFKGSPSSRSEDGKRGVGGAKMSIEAVKLTSEVIKIYIVEALSRAGEQAKREDASEVTLEHFEKILPQFLLDFN